MIEKSRSLSTTAAPTQAIFICQIHLIAWMAQQIFINSSMSNVPVMTLDSRDTQKQGWLCTVVSLPPPPKKNMSLANIFATFHVTSCLHEQFSRDKFYLSLKPSMPVFQQMNLSHVYLIIASTINCRSRPRTIPKIDISIGT